MKNFLLFLAFCVGISTLNAQTVLFEDDFESYTITTPNTGDGTQLPPGFTSYDVNGDAYNWGLSNPTHWTQPMNTIYTGNFMASVSYHTGPNVAVQADNIMVLPMISIPADATDVMLSFYAGSGTDTSFFAETYDVIVTTVNTEAAILAATPIYTETLSFQGGEVKTIELDDFVGQDIYISFYHRDTFDQWVLGIDDISVTMGEGGGPTEYCEVTYTNNIEPITHVLFAGIDNTTDATLNGTPGHELFLEMEANVEAGQSYDITLEGNTDGNFTNTYTVFFDWNQDGDFTDAGEMYEAGSIMASTGTDGAQAITSIAVPGDAMSGSTRMRVIKDWTLTATPVWPSDPCGTYDFGQTEDYTVVVGGSGPGGDDCEQSTPSNAFENGHGFIHLAYVAHDFEVAPETTFTADQFTFNVITLTATQDVTLTFYEDAGGMPGTQITQYADVVPTSITNVGTAFGFNVESTVVDLPTPLVLEGGATGADYWVSVNITNSGNSYWESTSVMNSTNEGYYSPDGVTWSVLSNGPWDGVFTISGTCETGEEPAEGCLDAENGQYPSGAAIVPNCVGTPQGLTGGLAWTGEYSLVQVTAGTEYIFSLSDTSYFVTIGNEDGTAVLASGTGSVTWTAPSDQAVRFYAHFDSDCNWDATTFLERFVQCGDIPPPPTGICEEQEVPSNNLENGLFFGGDTDQSLAVDVIVGDEGFTVYGVDLNVFTDGNTDLDFTVTFYEDDGGLPGTVSALTTASINSSEFVGNAFGFDVYNYVIAFATPVDLDANSTYWMQIESDGLAWEATSATFYGAGLVFSNTNTGGVWTLDPATELVYDLVCEELGVSDMSSFDFAYYPNPVKDVLNIDAKKAISNVSVSNLAGQQVMNKVNVNNGQVDVTSLNPGVYVFRVTLEGGQVETFKIIKK